jgi:chemotaxis family two-component system response regulator Rcp1
MSLDQPIEILLVEDNPADVRLTREALRATSSKYRLHVVAEGEAAVSFLTRREPFLNAVRPDLILLDLNLPKKDGRQVLQEIKDDPQLRVIPVIVLTTSSDPRDIYAAYDLHANCYLQKPVDLHDFLTLIRSIEQFWLRLCSLPGRADQS